MISSLFSGNFDFIEFLINLLMSIPAVLLALTLHESAHAYVAYKLGDPTAKLMGRITLNPLAHFDLVGALCMLLFHFGWAKPVQVDPRMLKHPKRDMALISVAGPISNLLVGFIFCGIWMGIWYAIFLSVPGALMHGLPEGSILSILLDMIEIIVVMNFALMVFNLLPVPPLDGSKVLFALLPSRAYRFVLTYERYGMAILMLWILLGDYLPWFLQIDFYLSWLVDNVFGVSVLLWDNVIGYLVNLFV